MIERPDAAGGPEPDAPDAVAQFTARYVSQMAIELAKLASSVGLSRSSAFLTLAASEVDCRLSDRSRDR